MALLSGKKAVERRMMSKIDSVPDIATWKKAPCRIRRGEFKTYNDAILYEEELSQITDTESEEKYVFLF